MTPHANTPSELWLVLWSLPGIAAAITFAAMKLLKKQQSGEFSVKPIYHAPDEVSPAEAGLLLRGTPAGCDLSATLLDLARRNIIAIRARQPATSAPTSQPALDYEFHLLQKDLRHGDLAPHESTLIFHLFYGGELTTYQAVRERFAIALPAFRRDVRNQLLEKDLLRYEPVIPSQWGGAAATTLVFIIFAGVQSEMMITGFFMWMLISLLGASLGAIAFLGLDGDRRTRDGRLVHAKVLGFREFLMTVNADRLKVLPLETLRENIAFAIALGVANQWTRLFDAIGEAELTGYPELNAMMVQAERLEEYFGGLSFETIDALMNAPRGGVQMVERFIAEGEKARRETTIEERKNNWWDAI